jgi:hypothetical protein
MVAHDDARFSHKIPVNNSYNPIEFPGLRISLISYDG